MKPSIRIYLQVSVYNRDLEWKKQTHKGEAPKATEIVTPSKWVLFIKTKQQWAINGSNASHVPLRNKYETQL